VDREKKREKLILLTRGRVMVVVVVVVSCLYYVYNIGLIKPGATDSRKVAPAAAA